MIAFLKSLISVANPFHAGYPAWAVMIWLVWIAVTLLTFAVFETLGMKRWHGAVPLTWVIRTMVPHLTLLVFGIWWVIHFVFQHNPVVNSVANSLGGK